VRLRDGTRIRIRPIRSEDKQLIARGLERLSEQSRYRRFFTPLSELSREQLAYLTELDHHDHEAVVALDQQGEAIGVARYVRSSTEPWAAEAAIAVVDEWHGRGVGRALMNRLVSRARQEGVSHFTALVQADNRAVLELIGGVRHTERSRVGQDLKVMIKLPRRGLGAQLVRLLRAAAAGSLKATSALQSKELRLL
jgi:GNAT superfamily N-acetyltransferase